MRRSLAALTTLAAAAAVTPPAHAQQTAGGAEYVPLTPSLTVSPSTVTSGAPMTLRFRVKAQARRVKVRVDLLPAQGPSRSVATLKLGRRKANRRIKVAWTPPVAPGSYVAQLRVTTVGRRASATSPLQIQAASAGVFPVQGPYSFGGDGSRFGAVREGHVHQGQDVTAAAGTPIVAPRAGTILRRAYQAAGAGHYVVLHGDDSRDYVFMHMQSGSVVVDKQQAVAAGQQIGAVGSSGHSSGPHLHFEIWPDGWYSSKSSQPIDPLPDLLAWAG